MLASRPRHPTHAVEAAALTRVGRWYYLSVSFDYCCRGLESGYRVMVGRSTSPAEPFVDRTGRAMLDGGGTQVVGTHDDVIGPGGADVSDVDGRYRVVHHSYDGATDGRPHLAVKRPGCWTPPAGPTCPDRSPAPCPSALVTAEGAW